MKSIHAFKVRSIEGGVLDFADFKGKKIMIVNTASECGYTPQYQQLQELHENFSDTLAIVGMPCNDFGGQEPEGETTIEQFCSMRYGVTFPLSAKVNILNEPHPVYQFLTQKKENGVADSTVQWNFQKYLLNESGELVKVVPASTSPLDDEILAFINN
jgi:glutathione peroxidase